MEERHQVKRVQLPSGRTIEVVYFAEEREVAAPSAQSTPSTAEPDQELHVCLDCDSGLVQPVEWDEEGPHNWRVLLRCPNCEIYREGVFSQACVESFDEVLDEGADDLARDYKRLLRSNMGAEVERFSEALAAGAILPEDF
jgi:hypothetical protein